MIEKTTPRAAPVPGTEVVGAERVLSGVLGAFLLKKGLGRLSLPGLAVAATGGWLVHRCVTGRCLLGELLLGSARREAPEPVPDAVEEASEESFPASDAPGWR